MPVFLLVWSDRDVSNARPGIPSGIGTADSKFGLILTGLNNADHLLRRKRGQQRRQAMTGDGDGVGSEGDLHLIVIAFGKYESHPGQNMRAAA